MCPAFVRHQHWLLGLLLLVNHGCSVATVPGQPRDSFSSTAQARKIAAAHRQAVAEVDRICDWQLCHGEALGRVWSLVAEWAAAYLEAHPAASMADLEASLAELTPRRTEQGAEALQAEAIELSHGVFALSVSYGETGTFFVIARRDDGTVRPSWSVDSFAGSLPADSDLRCWSVKAPCPLFGSLHLFSPAAGGNPRFYVHALFASNGMTVGGQTSVWEWRRTRAIPLGVAGYLVMIDDPRQVELDGEYLTIPIKEMARFLLTTAPSPDPAGTWTFRITPDRTEDLGHRWRDPELELVDRLFDALKTGKSAEEMASPEVVAKLTPIAPDMDGELFSWEIKQDGEEKTLSMDIDDQRLTFRLIQRDRHPYAIDVVIGEDSPTAR